MNRKPHKFKRIRVESLSNVDLVFFKGDRHPCLIVRPTGQLTAEVELACRLGYRYGSRTNKEIVGAFTEYIRWKKSALRQQGVLP